MHSNRNKKYQLRKEAFLEESALRRLIGETLYTWRKIPFACDIPEKCQSPDKLELQYDVPAKL
jgi:hypothetical protein